MESAPVDLWCDAGIIDRGGGETAGANASRVAKMNVDDDCGLARIRQELDRARREINRQNPDLALVYLKDIKDVIEKHPYSAEWAEFPLLTGEAYLAKKNGIAGEFLRDSLARIGELKGDHEDLALRANRGYGDYLDLSVDLRHRAREHYERARQIASVKGFDEDEADLTLKIIRNDLQVRGDPELSNFQMLKRDAGAEYTCREQVAAWQQYRNESECLRQDRVFARQGSVASEEYFRDLLKLVREALRAKKSAE